MLKNFLSQRKKSKNSILLQIYWLYCCSAFYPMLYVRLFHFNIHLLIFFTLYTLIFRISQKCTKHIHHQYILTVWSTTQTHNLKRAIILYGNDINIALLVTRVCCECIGSLCVCRIYCHLCVRVYLMLWRNHWQWSIAKRSNK